MEIIPFYQNIYFFNQKTNDIHCVGSEILMRFKPDGISSFEMIKGFKKSGILFEKTIGVVKMVLKSTLIKKDLKFISFNFPFSLIKEGGGVFTIDYIASMFNAFGVSVVIEITEDEMIDIDILDKLYNSTNYISFSLDDFGVCNSNLFNLASKSIGSIKLDSFFCNHLHLKIIRDLIFQLNALCSRNNIMVICEGVERQEQLNILKKLGVKYYQGFLFHFPQPVIF